MTELKYGGSDVKIMYGDREIGGVTKLEPGTIIYTGDVGENIHLLSSGKKWKNISEIRIKAFVGTSGYTAVDEVVALESLPVTLKSESYNLDLSKSEIDDDYGLNVAASWGRVSLEISIP